ncbi:MAG: hypothetical protein ACLPLP_08355 [Mycobacterium sp.]
MSKKTLDERIADRLARIGDEAEAGEEDQVTRPIPAHVKVTRGNARSKVLQVRLNPDEYAAIERIAKGRRLPPSTVAREALLKLIAEEDAQDPLAALVALADRIKAAAADVAYTSGKNAVLKVFPFEDADQSRRLVFIDDSGDLAELREALLADPSRLAELREALTTNPDLFKLFTYRKPSGRG